MTSMPNDLLLFDTLYCVSIREENGAVLLAEPERICQTAAEELSAKEIAEEEAHIEETMADPCGNIITSSSSPSIVKE
jgi:hypothetical protein